MIMDTTTSKIIETRKKKVRELREHRINLFPNDFVVTHTIDEIQQCIEQNPGSISEAGPHVSAAGRMMAINKFGKAAFIRFKDRTGQMQAYLQRDKIGSDTYALFKKLDIGDIVGVKGVLFQTRTGEWTILVDEFRLLSKSFRPLPEKFHGLKDPEKRYRQRYLDLIMNPDTRSIFVKRNQIVQAIRTFLIGKDFLEVETPMMQPIPGGAEATPFKTHHNALDMDLYLRIAPELYLKRLIIGGFERVFEINRNFRNEGISTRHNPEFTMMEFYQAYATYENLMDMTEEMFNFVALETIGTATFQYQGETVRLNTEWQRLPLLTALQEIGGVEKALLNDREGLIQFATSHGITLTKTERIGKIITKIFDILVEPKLIQPTFITGYPVEVSPLSRRSDTHPDLTYRF
jgi:lysyl-tRNA synthetase class 2